MQQGYGGELADSISELTRQFAIRLARSERLGVPGGAGARTRAGTTGHGLTCVKT